MVDKENVPVNSIVVLVDHDNKDIGEGQLGRWDCIFKEENTKKEYLRFSLVEDFKGLESNVVFYVHNITTPENYNYVAFTRAKYYLYELILKK